MITTIDCIIVFVLLVIAGGLNGIMYLLQFHFYRSIFSKYKSSFWNPQRSWENKWKWDRTGNKTVMVEKFWGSSRWFVWTTDAWHLIKFFMIKVIFIIIFYIVGLKYGLVCLGWYVGFWITYESKLLKK